MAWNMKDENEVKQFLENLGDEYRFGCFSEKKPDVCHLMADYLESIKADWERAGKLYKTNCDRYNWPHSCFKYGNYLYSGRGGVEKDPAKALEYYDKGCEGNFPEACYHSGILRAIDIPNIVKDEKKAAQQFEKGCELNQPHSCFMISGLFLSGVENVLGKDLEKAFKFAVKACDLENIHACANVSQMYKRGDGVAKDEKKSEEYKQKALEIQMQHTKQTRTITFGEGG